MNYCATFFPLKIQIYFHDFFFLVFHTKNVAQFVVHLLLILMEVCLLAISIHELSLENLSVNKKFEKFI